ncbi:MAG: DNA polymerase I [endosymbiont of Seepiophila jonesi]|uniref:DNA polymerase I n=1 Tax=endosymbiont of Lamellibrachia luymesi TaxID=2200907 RepID=A0A370DZ00_9GAMM|nr:MAG: DNA polymerase I [endosymbiont of Lamellibrachia luymesi]RDH94449.1 MAG: DNA polymerase I [endosymbiont of Seepiophila jonesi]
MTSSKPFILIDGSSYLFRAFHALPPLANSKGDPTGAIVGVLNMLRRLIDDYSPEYIAVVFDAPGGSFRNQLYSEYKAHRPPMPEELRVQIEPLHDIIRAMGLPLLMIEGVEADDVIGTLAQQATDLGLETLISTGDKDMAQLVNAHVSLVNTMSETFSDRQGVFDKFGVTPEQIIDYLALVGDSADNIPGVPKCGPKTAAKWLAAYGDLDNLIGHADEIKGKIGENLRNSLDFLPLSRTLTTIKLDVPLELGPKQYLPTPPDTGRLREHYTRMESSRLLSTLVGSETPVEEKPAAVEQHYETILTETDFNDWLKQLQQADLFAFDTETTSLDYMQAEIVGVSFSIEPGRAAYVPVAHSCPGTPQQLEREWVLTQLKPLLEDSEHAKVGQNLKYDMSVLARYGIELRGIAFDTMLESYVWDSTATRHDMDSLAKKYLGHETIHFEDVAGKGKKQLTFDQIPLEQASPYAAEDADITLRLHQRLWPKIESESSLTRVLQSIEIPLVPVLSRIERNGVLIDREMLTAQSRELAEGMHNLEQQAYEVAGHPFNMASPKQIGQIFFEELELPIISKTPKGAPSTAESVLVELAEQGHQLPALILEHRGMSKLKSTYTDKLPEMVNPVTGRVHTSYHQAVAATGRLSSSDPNLQNIPVRSEAGRRIRQAFVPQPGWKMVAADYSQIELRIMAHLSGDEGLLQAFAEGKDIHRATAAEVFSETLEAVTPDQRRSAKAINFGLIYGMSAFGLAKQLGIERSAAQEYIDLYFSRYPGVQTFMDRTRESAHELGYVETLFGRRLYLPEINARGPRKAAAERTAINAPMQGTAADIIKRAMLAVDDWIESEQPPVRLLMQVHDELVVEVQKDYVETASTMLREKMEFAAELAVPLVVDVGVGDNWDEAH